MKDSNSPCQHFHFSILSFISILFLNSLYLLAPFSHAAEEKPTELQNVDISPTLGTQISLDTPFIDEEGRAVRLGQYFDGKQPVALFMAYYRCPMLCGMIMGSGRDTFEELDWRMGEKYKVLSVSINPREKAAEAKAKKASILSDISKNREPLREQANAHWHFLVGSEASTAKLAREIGFKYVYDKETGDYGHGSAMFVFSPSGVLTRVLFGMDFSARDVKLALLEASAGKVGSIAEKILLFCYHYDPKGKKYALFATRLMRAAGVVTLLIIAMIYWRIHRRKNAVA